MNTGDQGSFPGANVPKFNIWRQQTAIFQQVAAYDSGGAGLNLTGNDHPEQVQGVHVSADYFSILGAPVIAGRTFTAAEDSPHGGNFVVLSYGLWKRRYGGDRGIVGNNIQLNGQPYQVELNVFADDAAISAKSPLPQTVTEYNHILYVPDD